jgi:chitodextrinase
MSGRVRVRIRGVAVLSCAVVVVAAGLTTAAVASAAENQNNTAAPAADGLLSRGKPVTASTASSCCAAANAVDGKAATRWASTAGKDPSWIYVDLGAPAMISRVRLQWDKSCAAAYQLQTSTDHETWTSIYTTTAGKGGVEDRTGLTGTGRYVRMLGTKRCRTGANFGYSLQEFDVYGVPGGGEPSPPTAPGTPTQVSITSNSVTVSWAASADNVGIAAYNIFSDGQPCGSVAGDVTTGTCLGLTPDADHTITVVAVDPSGNVSAPSAALSVHTPAGPGGPPDGNPYGDPNLVSMFNGVNLDGWTAHAAGAWTVTNGAIHGNGTSRGWLYYNKQQVGTFRWIFNLRQIKGNHQPTVLIWGTTNPIRDALSGIQFQPPNGGHWDYRPGKNNGGGSLFKQLPHDKININQWSQCEIIGNQSTGVARMACCPLAPGATTCKGVEVLDFTDKTAGQVGPLAIQVHNANINDEYKSLYVESPVITKPDAFITTS